MHIKRRGVNAMLYRSSWVPRGAQGNTHGFAVQRYVGSLSIDALEMPEELAARLSENERAFVEERVLRPARLVAERQAQLAEARSRDPLWRADEAIRLLKEAAVLCAGKPLPTGRFNELREVVAVLLNRNREPDFAQSKSDPLGEAVAALQAAAEAVASGRYGSAPAGASRKSTVYQSWQAVTRHVEGGASGEMSLLRALQARGWVKTRGV